MVGAAMTSIFQFTCSVLDGILLKSQIVYREVSILGSILKKISMELRWRQGTSSDCPIIACYLPFKAMNASSAATSYSYLETKPYSRWSNTMKTRSCTFGGSEHENWSASNN